VGWTRGHTVLPMGLDLSFSVSSPQPGGEAAAPGTAGDKQTKRGKQGGSTYTGHSGDLEPPCLTPGL